MHADLHNHTLLSDGAGDPAAAFPSMRDAGLDVAALTDHAIRGAAVEGTGLGGTPWIGLDRAGWRRTAELADAHDRPGEFTAIRGFEWSHPRVGHVNAWFTDDFTDVATHRGMAELYAWLTQDGRRNGVRGVAGLAGFNHPGREDGRFAGFRYAAAAAEQMVSLEMFNRGDDYLFKGVAAGGISPLVACLNAGWRTGLLGVSDEHTANWGLQPGTGRGGLWVIEHSRAGVAEALRARRFFATRVAGLRVDATAGGVRMGSVLPHRQGSVEFVLDVDCGPSWAGRTLQVQVLRPDTPVPVVAERRRDPLWRRRPLHRADEHRGWPLDGAAPSRPRRPQQHRSPAQPPRQQPRHRLHEPLVPTTLIQAGAPWDRSSAPNGDLARPHTAIRLRMAV